MKDRNLLPAAFLFATCTFAGGISGPGKPIPAGWTYGAPSAGRAGGRGKVV